MLDNLKLEKVLFLDIETVPCEPNFEDLNSTFQKLWKEKTQWQRKEEFTPSEFYKLKSGVLARRILINELKLPKLLDIAGKKPWEINHLDTMELWRFGDYKNYTSIKLLSALFGIPTPKDDIDGSQVARLYWEENDLEKIKIYCQKDTLTVAQLLLKYKGQNLIKEENIEFV